MPTISVIVPVYRVEPYLHRCVDSILGQTYTDFELILVDDGSPDNCPAICDEYAEKDSRVHVIHQENGGLSAARNAGINWAFSNSDSQWLSFIDSDDWVHTEYLERLLNAAQKMGTSISVCAFARTYDEALAIDINEYRPELWKTETFFVDHYTIAVVACAKLYKKELFSKIMYPVGRLHEDEFITYKLLFMSNQLAIVFAPLYWYYQNNTGITQSQWTEKRLDALIACEERLDYFRKKGNVMLMRHTISIYFSYIQLSITKISELEDKCKIKRHNKLLRKCVRQMLNRHKMITITDAIGIYEFAYPMKMKLYWLFQGLKNRLNNLFIK